MAKTREKKMVHTGVTEENMVEAFAAYAKADAKVQKINATMDVDMVKIREKYAFDLASLAETKDNSFAVIQAYAMENKNLFTKRRSVDTLHGVFGFRLGTPKAKTLKGFTWESVMHLLKEFLPDYVRTTEVVAKDRLIDDRDNAEIAKLYGKCGVQVVQEDTFFVEPKKEE